MYAETCQCVRRACVFLSYKHSANVRMHKYFVSTMGHMLSVSIYTCSYSH